MKNFFKLFGLIAIVAMIGMGLAGCKTEAENGGGGGIPADLLGLWSGTYDGSTTTTAEFKSDNTLVTKLGASAGTTYKVNGVSDGTVSIQSSGANTTDGTFRYAISGNTMTVSQKVGNGNAMYANSYTKQ
ncbi:hypothetical protein AGMMS49546_09300 [Spirochaetia bacterium]|nr:hypothetical protein AGMMS49546_09300 [Spirochaetia bacterium]